MASRDRSAPCATNYLHLTAAKGRADLVITWVVVFFKFKWVLVVTKGSMVHLRSVWLRDLKFDSHLNLKYPRLKSLTYLKDKESKKGRVFIKMILLWKASLINVSGKAKGVLHKSNKTVKYAHQIGRKKYNQLSPFCSNKRQSFNLSLAAAKCQFQLTALRQQCVSYLSPSFYRNRCNWSEARKR